MVAFGRRPLPQEHQRCQLASDIGLYSQHTSTSKIVKPIENANGLENTLNPNPTNSPSTLPRLIFRTVVALMRLLEDVLPLLSKPDGCAVASDETWGPGGP